MRALSVNRISNLLHLAFGAPVAPLSVSEMSARGFADRSGRVLPRWTHAGAGRRAYDVQAPGLSTAVRAEMERHAPALPAPDHAAYMLAEGLVKYPAAYAANVQTLAEVA